MAKIIVRINGNKEIINTLNVNTADAEAVRIKAQAGVNYELQDQSTGTAPENVMVQRSGNDLLVAFEGSDITQPDLIIEGYYEDAMYANLLIGQHENGRYYTYVAESGQQSDNVVLLADHIASGQALSSNMLASNFYSGSTPASSTSDYNQNIATSETKPTEIASASTDYNTPTYTTSEPNIATVDTTTTDVAQAGSGWKMPEWSSDYTPFVIGGAVGLLALGGIAAAIHHHNKDDNDDKQVADSSNSSSSSPLIIDHNATESVTISYQPTENNDTFTLSNTYNGSLNTVAGDDIVNVSGTIHENATLTGGVGIDTLAFNGDNISHTNWSKIAGFEIIKLNGQADSITLDSVLVSNNHAESVVATDGTVHHNVLIVEADGNDTVQTNGANQQGTVDHNGAEYQVYTFTADNQNYEVWVNNEAIIA